MYGVSCLAMLANFLSGLELPAREVAELGAAETNEMRAGTFLLSRSPNSWRPVFGAQAWANYNRGGQSTHCSALHSSQYQSSSGGRKGSSAH